MGYNQHVVPPRQRAYGVSESLLKCGLRERDHNGPVCRHTVRARSSRDPKSPRALTLFARSGGIGHPAAIKFREVLVMRTVDVHKRGSAACVVSVG